MSGISPIAAPYKRREGGGTDEAWQNCEVMALFAAVSALNVRLFKLSRYEIGAELEFWKLVPGSNFGNWCRVGILENRAGFEFVY